MAVFWRFCGGAFASSGPSGMLPARRSEIRSSLKYEATSRTACPLEVPSQPEDFALAARWHQRGPATLHSRCSASSAKPPSQRSSRHCTMPPKVAKQVREKTNWLIHMLYIRQDYDQCLEKIEEALKGCNGMAECAPLPLSHTSHRRACSHAVTVARRPHLRQGTDQAPARRDPGLAAALPGGDLPQPAQHLQPEAGRPLALPPREAQGGARRVRGGAAHRHRRLGDLA